MQSLRTRRPSESRPVKRQGSKLAKAPSTRQNARKSTVDDKMKKRMSLRYAVISSPTDPSVPAVPTVPLGLRPGAPRDPDEIVRDAAHPKEDPRLLDQRLLDREDFDPDDCVYSIHAVRAAHEHEQTSRQSSPTRPRQSSSPSSPLCAPSKTTPPSSSSATSSKSQCSPAQPPLADPR